MCMERGVLCMLKIPDKIRLASQEKKKKSDEKNSAWVNMTFHNMNREQVSISLSNVCSSFFVYASIVLCCVVLVPTNKDEIVWSAPLNSGQCIV